MHITVFRDASGFRTARVWLDGVDVTNDCQVADDNQHFVQVLRRDARGRAFVDPQTGNVAIDIRYGHVRIEATGGD